MISPLFQHVEQRIAELTAIILRDCGPVVQTGPFAGLKLPAADRGSAYLPKLCGTYEQEITAACIDQAQRAQRVINIGCGEGWYAVGLSQWSFVVAIDTAQDAREKCAINALANGRKLALLSEFSPALVDPVNLPATFILCDVEGAEETLLDPVKLPGLQRCAILVECHEFLKPGITDLLSARFARSHRLQVFQHAGRDPNSIPAIAGWPQLDGWLAVLEGRPGPTPWLLAVPR